MNVPTFVRCQIERSVNYWLSAGKLETDEPIDRSRFERLKIPHTFKPRLSFAEASIAVAEALLRIFTGSLLFGVRELCQGVSSWAAWRSAKRRAAHIIESRWATLPPNEVRSSLFEPAIISTAFWRPCAKVIDSSSATIQPSMIMPGPRTVFMTSPLERLAIRKAQGGEFLALPRRTA